MTRLRTIFAITAALGANPALADQTWWIIPNYVTPAEPSPHCRPPTNDGGADWTSPAAAYEGYKDSLAEIIDEGDEVDVKFYDFGWHNITFYRTKEACLKAVQAIKDTEATKEAADAARKAKEDKLLEKYR